MIAGHSLPAWQRAFPKRTASLHPVRVQLSPRRRDVGVVERRNPLPVGRYWVDVFEKDAASFAAWLAAHKADVRVRTTQHFDTTPARDWVLFEVVRPVDWQGPGLPDVATGDVVASSDTVQRPPPEKDALQKISDAFSGSGTALVVLGVAAIAALAFMNR